MPLRRSPGVIRYAELHPAVTRTEWTVPSAEDQALAAARARAVRRALAVLPGRCPELMTALAESPELTYRQLAARLGLPRGSIGPTRSRCLACLRALLHNERPE
ncbi:hypothetical protein ACIA8O_21465 [Kitasatospora sp. NPDC051853]|uniref:hypothetical protein n=1 Tax=Kitasatospora sp. NPDC051853 TaxID=3364058 RepID=UPI00378A6294